MIISLIILCAAVIAILLLLSTVVIAFIVMRNFGSGLKSKSEYPFAHDLLFLSIDTVL